MIVKQQENQYPEVIPFRFSIGKLRFIFHFHYLAVKF